MKRQLRVLLPIAAIAAIVFGITFATSYFGSSQESPQAIKDGKSPLLEPPLRFFVLSVDPSAAEIPAYLKNWTGDVEVGTYRHFDYWCQNRHAQPVSVSVINTNCQCTSAELGIVDPKAWSDYGLNLASGAFMGSERFLWNMLGVADLDKGIAWRPLSKDGTIDNAEVPAMKNSLYQQAIVRLSWVGKGEPSPRTITAELVSKLPDATTVPTLLSAKFSVVGSFTAVAIGSRERDVKFGDLIAGSSQSRGLIVWSATRPSLDVEMTLSGSVPTDPNLEWTKLEPFPPEALDVLSAEFSRITGKSVHVKSAYKTILTLSESKEVEVGGKKTVSHLDLGPYEKFLSLNLGQEKIAIPLHAVVRGDIRLIGGPKEQDRVDFGPAYPSKMAKTREVSIVAEKPDLQLEIVRDQINPPYLVAELIPEAQRDGSPQWTLRVSIPANKLFGPLPPDSAILLQTKDTKRKIRIPVQAKTVDNIESPF